LNSLDLIRSGASNGLTAGKNLIIVYGIQRTDVKNCFYEEMSCKWIAPVVVKILGMPEVCRGFSWTYVMQIDKKLIHFRNFAQ
jgi:hypothetical protein